MPDNRWSEIASLVAAAQQMSPPERQKFFDEIPEELRQQVASYVDHGDASFLKTESLGSHVEAFYVNPRISKRFNIIRPLGEGAMGQVFEAEDKTLGKHVALKFPIHDLAAGSEGRKRFLREVRLAQSITHPNVCRIHDIHTDASTAVDDPEAVVCFSMELLKGCTLQERLKNGPLPLSEAEMIVLQLTEGLAAAHEKDVIHRDFKPGNIFLEPVEGGGVQVVITDFGLAYSEAGGDTVTKAGTFLGTIAYASPEQLKGEKLTKASDIWALGVVMYEMVCGTRPFKADAVPTLAHKIVYDTPVKPSAVYKDLPPAWETAILGCLAKQPEQRFADLRNVRAALRGEQVTVAMGSVVRPRRTGPVWKYGIAAAIAVALALATPRITGVFNETAGCDDNARLASSKEAHDLFLKGNDLFEGQANRPQLSSAIETLDSAVQKDANFALAHAKLSDARVTLSRNYRDPTSLRQAEFSATRAVQLADCLPEAHFALGSVYTDLKKFDAAKKELEKGISLATSPSLSSEGHRRLGRVYHEQGNKQLALNSFEKAVELNPSDFKSADQLARAYFRYGMAAKAVDAYTKVTELAPNRPEGFQGLGLSYLTLGDVPKSLEPLKRATSLQRTSTNIQALASAHFYSRQYGEAVRLYMEASKAAPQSFTTMTNLVSSLTLAGESKRAQEYARLSIGLTHDELAKTSNSVSALESQAICYARLARFGEARATIERARKLRPDLASLTYTDAAITALSGSVDESLVKLEHALTNQHPVNLVPFDPDFDPVRSTPKYKDIISRFATK
jgi:tetratricopeptide (TPR) repeat protein